MPTSPRFAETVDQTTNPGWRLNNLYYIVDNKGHKVQFKLNTAQFQLYNNLHTLNLILKARQLGISTFIDLFILDQCFFNSNVSAGIVAHALDDAKKIFATKIKFPYDHLPEGLRAMNPPVSDSKSDLELKNGSRISVGTSHRSGSLQLLHISEYGKICARFPDKAEEIKTGALNTIAPGQMAFIESTAAGKEGDFYERVTTARGNASKHHTQLDWKFHFFPWWIEPDFRIDPQAVVIPKESETYFAKIEAQNNLLLSPSQKAWYVKKQADQGEAMSAEFPSTPDEPFAQAIEGAYFAAQMLRARKENRIGAVPITTRLPVNSFWDIGINDLTTIWLHQHENGANRFVGYYYNEGEGLAHYINYLRDWGRTKEIVWGRHHGPHDIDTREFGAGLTRKEQAAKLMFKFEVVPRVMIKGNAIEAARAVLSTCYFDETACKEGIKHLEHYRKEWNDTLGVWRDTPRHDENSHGADSFQTFATGYRSPPPIIMLDRYRQARAKPTGSYMAV